jgi:hypothetical protein
MSPRRDHSFVGPSAVKTSEPAESETKRQRRGVASGPATSGTCPPKSSREKTSRPN